MMTMGRLTSSLFLLPILLLLVGCDWKGQGIRVMASLLLSPQEISRDSGSTPYIPSWVPLPDTTEAAAQEDGKECPDSQGRLSTSNKSSGKRGTAPGANQASGPNNLANSARSTTKNRSTSQPQTTSNGGKTDPLYDVSRPSSEGAKVKKVDEADLSQLQSGELIPIRDLNLDTDRGTLEEGRTSIQSNNRTSVTTESRTTTTTTTRRVTIGSTITKSEVSFLTTEQYNQEATARIATISKPSELAVDLFADASQTQNPAAICFDRKGKLYLAEVHRWRNGVEDIRYEERLLLDDIDNQNTADRRAMYERDQSSRPLSFYTEFSDRIVVIEDRNRDGRADSSQVFAEGFNDVLSGLGIGLLATEDDSIYYTNIPNLWKLEASTSDGAADSKTSILEGFGVRMGIAGHDMHGLIRGPDGRIYWSIGDRGYHVTGKEGQTFSDSMAGAVFRCELDGSGLEVFYTGLRNPQELAFDQFGNLFTCDNDADRWDSGRLVYLIEGGDSGWHHGHQAILNFKKQLQLRTPSYDHPGQETVVMNPWLTEGLWDPSDVNRPAFALPPVDLVAQGAAGLVYNYGHTAMPERYANHFWVCNFDGARGNLEAFSIKPKGAGFALDNHEKEFVTGLGNTDVEFGPDGKMYVCCFNNHGWVKQDVGSVYTLYHPDRLAQEAVELTHALLVCDIESKEVVDLVGMLYFGDMRVRQRAQFALVKRNEVEVLMAAVEQDISQVARLHGIWGLGQVVRHNQDGSIVDYLIGLLEEGDAEIRAQVARVLADSKVPRAGLALAKALEDSSARVQSFAAIGVGKCQNFRARGKLLELLATNSDQDLFLRHSCVLALQLYDDSEWLLEQVNADSPAIRLGALLALRRLKNPGVEAFLNDQNEPIRYAAIRAINDLNLVAALPSLAEHIERYTVKAAGIRPPENHYDWIIQHRLINANFREGSEASAKRLIDYATARHLPDMMRGQALDALLEWPDPTPVDPTVGFHRPLETRLRIEPTIKKNFAKVFDSVSGELLAKAIAVAQKNDLPVPEPMLLQLIRDRDAVGPARIQAIDGLAKQNPQKMAALCNDLFLSSSPTIRSASLSALIEIAPQQGIQKAVQMSESSEVSDRQAAYESLAAIESSRVDQFFADRLANIASEPKAAVLDLIRAAAQRNHDSVQVKLADYYSRHGGEHALAAYEVCLLGGDINRGKAVYYNHAAAQCAKCHRIHSGGGEAGPELTQIAERLTRAEILNSIINPSSTVAEGYGITLITLKGGQRMGGMLIRSDAKEVVLRMRDSIEVIPLANISAVAPPISAMPSMQGVVSKFEIRDLVAYLATLDGNEYSDHHQ